MLDSDGELSLQSERPLREKQRWTERGKQAIFAVLNRHSKEVTSQSAASYYTWATTEAVLQTLHTVSLLYTDDLSFPGWAETRVVWTFLSLSRIDKLSARWGVFAEWSYFNAALVTVCSGVFLLLVVSQLRFGTHSEGLSRGLFILPIGALARVMLIPSLCTSAALLKYAISPRSSVPEYLDLPSSVLDPGNFGFYLGPIGVLTASFALLEATTMFEISYADIRHFYPTCAHCHLRVVEKVASFTLVALHFSLMELHWIAFKSVAAVICSIVCVLSLFNLSYNSVFVSFLHVAQYGIAAFCSLCFIIGLYLNNAAVALSLFLVLLVPVLFFLRLAVNWRVAVIKKLAESPQIAIKNLYTKELVLRWKIRSFRKRDSSDKAATAELIGNFADFCSARSKTKLVVIWETRFCLDVLKDERLARIKLAKSLQCRGSLWEDFQEFKLHEILSADNCAYHEEVDFMAYQTLLDSAKSSDEQFCFLLLSFWSEVTSRTLVWKKMEKLLGRIDATLKELKHLYADLTKRYPKSPSALRLFGTFLRDLCNESIKADKILKKAETELQIQIRASRGEQSSKQFTYFNETNGLLIISGAPDTFGTVTFANIKAAHALGYPSVNAVVGQDVNQLVPPPFYENHHKHMRRYLDRCVSSLIEMPFTIFMRKLNGNIVEVYTSMKCTALESHPFFIVALRARASNREIALISPRNTVYVHTDGFPELLTGNYSNLQGRSLDELIPFYSEMDTPRRLFKVFRAKSRTKSHNMMVARSVINKVNIDILMVFTDKSEVLKWKGGSKNLEKQEFVYFMDYKNFSSASSSILNIETDAQKPDFSIDQSRSSSIRTSYVREAEPPKVDYHPENLRGKAEASLGTTHNDHKDSKTDITSFSSIMNTLYRRRDKAEETDSGVLRRAKKALVVLQGILLVLTLGLVAFGIGVLVYIRTYLSSGEDDAGVSQFLATPYELTAISDLARDIDFGARGFPLETEEETNEKLRNVTDALGNLKNFIVDGANHLSVFLQGEGRRVPLWTRKDGVDYTRLRSVEEVVGDLIASGLKTEERRKKGDLSDPDLYLLYRNGMSDSLFCLNSTLRAYIATRISFISSFQSVLTALCFFSVVVFLCCCALLVPALCSIQRTSLQVWSFFFDMSLPQVLEAKAKCMDRLEREHGHDLSLSLVSMRKPASDIRTRLKVRFPKEWLALAWKLTALLATSVAFYYELAQVGAKDLAGTQKFNVETAMELMEIRTLYRLSGLWLKEQAVNETDFAYKFVIPEGELFTNPREVLVSLAADIHRRQNHLFRRHQTQTLYECAHTLAEFQYELRVSETVTEADFLYFAEAKGDWELLVRLRTLVEELGICQLQRIAALKAETDRKEREMEGITIALTAGYCGVAVILYVALYRPAIRDIEKRINKVWKLSRLIVSRY